VLNTRLRQLRKLEEMEIRREDAALRAEQGALEALLASPAAQLAKMSESLAETREAFGPGSRWGGRRTELAGPPQDAPEIAVDAFVVREPLTVVLSEKGWIRALKGRLETLEGVKFKEGDEAAFVVRCDTTDKLVALASDGRAFTLEAHKLPGGRGAGEPIRLMIELSEEHDIVALFAHDPQGRRLIASSDGYGFIAPETELLTARKAGRQVLNVTDGARAAAATPVAGDHVAVIGENRKLLIFGLEELPEMARGKGVRLQTLREGGLGDVATFAAEAGFAWIDSAGRVRPLADWREYVGRRAGAGKATPKGFSRSGRFNDGPI
jgi:topoisomerase-4 subunit A